MDPHICYDAIVDIFGIYIQLAFTQFAYNREIKKEI
jgi:hypothetical protein